MSLCSPVAVAIYDYEAMAEPGEEGNLEFEEGDLIEVRREREGVEWEEKGVNRHCRRRRDV